MNSDAFPMALALIASAGKRQKRHVTIDRNKPYWIESPSGTVYRVEHGTHYRATAEEIERFRAATSEQTETEGT